MSKLQTLWENDLRASLSKRGSGKARPIAKVFKSMESTFPMTFTRKKCRQIWTWRLRTRVAWKSYFKSSKYSRHATMTTVWIFASHTLRSSLMPSTRSSCKTKTKSTSLHQYSSATTRWSRACTSPSALSSPRLMLLTSRGWETTKATCASCVIGYLASQINSLSRWVTLMPRCNKLHQSWTWNISKSSSVKQSM